MKRSKSKKNTRKSSRSKSSTKSSVDSLLSGLNMGMHTFDLDKLLKNPMVVSQQASYSPIMYSQPDYAMPQQYTIPQNIFSPTQDYKFELAESDIAKAPPIVQKTFTDLYPHNIYSGIPFLNNINLSGNVNLDRLLEQNPAYRFHKKFQHVDEVDPIINRGNMPSNLMNVSGTNVEGKGIVPPHPTLGVISGIDLPF